MQPTRFQLEAASLAELRTRVRIDYGVEARIVSAERVTVGGIGGFLARRHIEAVIEVPSGTEPAAHGTDPDNDPLLAPERAVLSLETPAPGTASGPERPEAEDSPVRARGRRAAETHQPLPERQALIDLLAEADGDEAEWHGRPEPGVSTESEDFDRLMDDLTFGAQPSSGSRAVRSDGPAARPDLLRPVGPSARTGPTPLRGPGDLVVVVGLGTDAHRAATALAGPGLSIHAAGAFAADAGVKGPRIGTRNERVQAQAAGVGTGEPVFIACGLDHAVDLETQVQEVEALGADQLWVSVDAGRKSEDTRAWVEALDAVCPVDGVAVHGRATTATPDTVLDLGIPLRDIDQLPAPPRRRAPGAR
ncbi:hypothetical protein JTF08_09375 [Micrococcaceae bacterium RIT802]|nr:hypothetical protein [Micrococcaceae bacterium RIT 802]